MVTVHFYTFIQSFFSNKTENLVSFYLCKNIHTFVQTYVFGKRSDFVKQVGTYMWVYVKFMLLLSMNNTTTIDKEINPL